MPSETYGIVEAYLKDVDDQISCKLGLSSVNEELRGHIEDKTALYMEYGLDREEACRRAVRDMGAPDVVGMELNKRRRLRTAKPLLFVVLALMAVGLTGELLRSAAGRSMSDIILEAAGQRYYLWGLLVLFLVARFGYPFLLRHTKGVCVFFLAVCAFFGGLYLSLKVCPGWVDRLYAYTATRLPGMLFHIFISLFRTTLFLGIIQLAVPVGAVLLYRKRNQYFRGIFFFCLFQALMILLGKGNFLQERSYIPILILLSSCLGTALYLLRKGWCSVKKSQGAAAALAGFCILLIFWAAPQWSRIRGNLEVCVNPGSRASVTDAWDDSYNNVLIRELLGRARAFGQIELTEEELVRYGTSQWYYEDGDGNWNNGSETSVRPFEEHVAYRMQFLEEPDLREILPQSYMENYRISWWALRYGWVPALFLTVLVLALPAAALWTAFRIRNRLGRLTAFSGALVFSVQTVFYLVENFGFQFGAFSNLPFVAEGLVSITGSAVLAGLILSAYRFDTVIEESEVPVTSGYHPASSDSGTPADKHRKRRES